MAEGVPAGLPGGDRRIYLIGAVAVVVVLIAVFFTIRSCGNIVRGPSYTVIYSHLELKDAADVVARLKDLKIPYEIRDEGKTIAVPKNRADEARLGLAEKNLPRGGTVGWEIFDETKLGATDFDRRIQFIRAISGELARTIQQIDAIDDARVQIVIPETRLFEAAAAPVTASVLLKLKPGEHLTGNQVSGIIHLVASSVENLKPENVTVVDIYGNILTPSSVSIKEEISPAPELPVPQKEGVSAPAETKALEMAITKRVEETKAAEMAKVAAKEEELKAKEAELNKKEEQLNKISEVKKPQEKVSPRKTISEEELKKKAAEEEKRPRVLTGEERALLRLKVKKEIDDQLSAKAQIVLNKFYPPNTVIVKVNVEIGKPKVEYVPSSAKIKGPAQKEVTLKAQEIVTLKRMTAVVLIDKKLQVPPQMKKDTFAAISGAIGYDRRRGDKIIMRRVPFLLAEAPVKAPSKQKMIGGTSVDIDKIITALRELRDKVVELPAVGSVISQFAYKKNLGKALIGLVVFLFVLIVLQRVLARRSEEGMHPRPEVPLTSPRRPAGEGGPALSEIRRAAETDPEKIASLLELWLSEEKA